MSVFVVVLARLGDPEKFAPYAEVVPELISKYGGQYRILGGEITLLEGEWDDRLVVVSEWPDKAAAEKFWNSPEYREAKKLREGAGEFTVLLIEGLPALRQALSEI